MNKVEQRKIVIILIISVCLQVFVCTVFGVKMSLIMLQNVIFLSLRKHKLAGKLSMFRTRSSKPFRVRSSTVNICGGRCDDITIVYFAL